MSRTWLALVAIGCALAGCAQAGPPPQGPASAGPRVVVVTLDGVRWQEIFRGADPDMLARLGTAPNPATLATLVRPDPQNARRVLLPFLWDIVVRRGQLLGNRHLGSLVDVSNPHRVSYPGYHELLTGLGNVSIVDNRRQPNPDVTVLEWLHHRPGFSGAVEAYASWDLFPFIINEARSGIPVSRWQRAGLPPQVDQLRRELPPPWKDSVYDAFVIRAALPVLQQRQPRVLYVALGDTDEWAHTGRYDRYLEALHRCDRWLAELWQTIESLPAYRGRTSLIITTDHGRGQGAENFSRHDGQVPGSEQAWVALMGPAVPARGERADHPPLTLSQVAATIAQLAGEDYSSAVPAAAPVLPGVYKAP